MSARDIELPLQADDGHRWVLQARVPAQPRATLLWLPALGVAARHYLPFTDALAAQGIAVFVHEWRGNGSSNLRAGHDCDWGYRELLTRDLPTSETAIDAALPDITRIAGGHSLGGQLACCRLGLAPDAAQQLWLVASGAPYWRAFPLPHRLWLPLAYRFLPWLAERRGALPGRWVRFAGNEARSLIRDWARSGLHGRYAAAGLQTDLESALERVAVPVSAVALREDWLGPESSLRFLLSKLRPTQTKVHVLGADGLGTRADHFAWMRQPGNVAAWLAQALEDGAARDTIATPSPHAAGRSSSASAS